MSRRVVITGLGTVNPLGLNVRDTWDGLVNGRSGVGPVTRFDVTKYGGFKTTIAAEVKGFDPTLYMTAKAVDRMDLFSQFATAAASQALQDSGIDLAVVDPDRVGCFVGTGVGGINTTCNSLDTLYEKGTGRVSSLSVAMLMPNAAAGNASITLGLKGMTIGVVSACAAGGDAIGLAFGAIKLGWADVALAGGTEAAITPIAFAGFINARAFATKFNEMSQEASRPFDKDRDGFIMGEGAGILVLEDLEHALARGAHIYAELAGYGARADAFHLTAPPDDGNGAIRAMKAALADARVDVSNVDYINAHGTSTPLNDKTETRAIKGVFGDRAYKIPVSSNKSMLGHNVGAAGANEAIASVLTIVNGVIPPTINYRTPDPDCDLDYVPNTAREKKVSVVISNTLGFGGHNSGVVIKKLKRN